MTALIGALRVSLSADTANFEAGMRRAQGQAASAASGISKTLGTLKGAVAGLAAGLSIGFFANLIKQGLDYASTLQSMSSTLGVTTKDLQTLRFAASQTGVSQEQLENGLLKLTVTMGKVAAGAVAPTKALQAIGITADEIKGKDTGQVFALIADALSKVTDRSQRAAVEVALFGRAGANLDGLLSGGSKALDSLSAAAEKLGIVLSDEQIQHAHDTAIRLEALKEVLSADIAGAVADNADSILRLANALVRFVSVIPKALEGWRLFINDIGASGNALLAGGNPFTAFGAENRAQLAAKNNADLAARFAMDRGTPTTPTGQDIGRFLAPKAPKPPREKRQPTDRSDELLAQAALQQLQAEQSILQAKQQLAGNSEERLTLAVQLLQLDKTIQDAQIDEKVQQAKRQFASHQITAATLAQVEREAAILKGKAAAETQVKLQALVEGELAKADQANFEAADQRLKFSTDALRTADQLATTQEDHRRIQLAILDSENSQKRYELEHEKQLAIRNGATAEQIKVIQDQIDNLPNERAQGAATIIRNTQGPLEQWAASVPKTAAQINEAFQNIDAQGLGGLIDQIKVTDLTWKNLGQTFENVGKDMLNMLFQLGLKMLLFRGLASVFPGLFGGNTFSTAGLGSVGSGLNFGTNFSTVPVQGFATGGSFNIFGGSGIDSIPLFAGAVHIANVSHGERISVAAANDGGGPVTVNQTFQFEGVAITQDEFVRGLALTKTATVAAIQDRRRRSS